MKEHQQKMLNIGKEYLLNHNQGNERRKKWIEHAPRVKSILDSIAIYLDNYTEFFKQNIYAVEYEDSGYPHLMLKSGNIPYQDDVEVGFQIHFFATDNGRIVVHVIGHTVKDEDAQGKTLELIENPQDLTEEKVHQLVAEGMEFAKSTSFLFQE